MRILLVDDNEDYLQMIGSLLKSHGYELLLATDGKQAREYLETEKVDLIMSDVFMPTLDGVKFHSYVRDFMDERQIPFIFISGYDDDYTRNAVLNSETDFFFSKVTPIDEIIQVIEGFKSKHNARIST